MTVTRLETKRLNLVLQTRAETLAQLEHMSPGNRAEVSPAWLAMVASSSSADPWVHGFLLVHQASGCVIGQCGFKGPPGADGMVEIAYGVAPEHQGQGYATEAAAALVSYALGQPQVRIVRAHTRPGPNASTHVLSKCGFVRIGEVIDPEDGPVWRWEIVRTT